MGRFGKVGKICVGQRIAFSMWIKYINEGLWGTSFTCSPNDCVL